MRATVSPLISQPYGDHFLASYLGNFDEPWKADDSRMLTVTVVDTWKTNERRGSRGKGSRSPIKSVMLAIHTITWQEISHQAWAGSVR